MEGESEQSLGYRMYASGHYAKPAGTEPLPSGLALPVSLYSLPALPTDQNLAAVLQGGLRSPTSIPSAARTLLMATTSSPAACPP